MILSRLILNVKDWQTRSELARPYEMHRTICTRGFGSIEKDALGRILFRVDTDRQGGNPLLFVQSDDEPDWSKLPVGYLNRPAEWKEFTPHLIVGQRLQFRLRANPTKRLREESTRRDGGSIENWCSVTEKGKQVGKRVGLATETEQIRWLLRKGETGGFRIPGEWMKALHPETNKEIERPNFRVDARPEGRARNDKPGFGGEFHAVLFDGVLEVTDPAAFLSTLSNGIGSAKGFGFGLLSVAPIKM